MADTVVGDPTYPFYPIACIVSAAMLFLVLLSSFVRQSWNLGVAFLCFWLFFESLTAGIDAIIWSDNVDIKLAVYCDIVTRMQMIAFVVKPMATLIITRRLYLITSRRSVELPDKAAKRKDIAIEWTLGFVIPLLTGGPFYYIVQQARFDVFVGFGCQNSPDGSLVAILLVDSWTVIPSILSITIYYPRLIWILYHQKRDMHHFLQSNDSVSRINYFRIFALASIDILLTLPISIVNIVLIVTGTVSQLGRFNIYSGWAFLHTDWEPARISNLSTLGTPLQVQQYFTRWASIILAFAIFGLFGITKEARASYWRVICSIGNWIGWKPTAGMRKGHSPMGTMEFGEQPQNVSRNLDIKTRPSYRDPDAPSQEQGIGSEHERATRELGRSSSIETKDEPHRTSNSTVNDAGHPIQHEQYEPHDAKPIDASDAV